jgi:hypothetical protein
MTQGIAEWAVVHRLQREPVYRFCQVDGACFLLLPAYAFPGHMEDVDDPGKCSFGKCCREANRLQVQTPFR